MKKLFNAAQFTPTQWSTAEDKAKFANHFVRFALGDFKDTLFPKWFYKRLSNCFGHIAHYNQAGFYETWFTSAAAKHNFLINALRFPCYGDPAFTYSDVEKALQVWIKDSGLVAKYYKAHTDFIEAGERAELARLKDKYEGATT